jgi:phosphopantothenoylcysteine synthetase/decarboxylase
LANNRIGFFCSHNHTEHFQEKANAPEEFYYELDFHILKNVSNAVLAIPGWEKSKGTVKEIEWAKENNLLVFYPKSTKDLDEVTRWMKR